ncbi:MAG: ABC transporter substrate-binding protein [Clostridiales bacterium]|jgi:peptide/nickel transport system substrate-binding protein|nr:ABC transporter substrate-binding protein [Clostridiales bacterium]
MTKRLLLLLSMLIIAVLVVAACGNGAADAPADVDQPAQQQEQPEQPDEPVVEPPADGTGRTHLNIVSANLAVSMDPHESNDSASAQQNKQMFSTLLFQCYDTFGPLPALAVAWDTPDAQTVNIELRQGVTFHNGDPLTAADVQFSLERAAASAEMGIIIGMLDSVTIHDDYNLTLHLEDNFAPILAHLAHPGTSIIPMNHVLAVGDDAFAQEPVGTGPFAFDNLVIGDRLELVRNDNYWGNLPQVESITWRQVPDPSTRLIEVSAGTADVAVDIAPADIPTAQADPNVNLITRQNLALNDWISLNTSRPPLDDIRVRQAIDYALDTEAIMRTAWGELGSPARGPISDIVWGFSPQAVREVNLDRARELLAEAGHADGFDLEIWWNTGNIQRMQVAEMVQFALTPLGINVEVHGMEWPTILELTAVTDPALTEHDMFIIGWVSVTADADYGLFPVFHSDNFGGAGNRAFWANAEVDELLLQGRSSVDPVERMEIYDRVQAIVAYEVPVIPIRQGMTAFAISPDLNGFTIAPQGHHSYAPVWFD